MRFVFEPERVCSKKFTIDVDERKRLITGFESREGCPGNLGGISRLICGMSIDDVIDRFENMPVCPTSKVSSCPDQLRRALLELRTRLDAGETSENQAQ